MLHKTINATSDQSIGKFIGVSLSSILTSGFAEINLKASSINLSKTKEKSNNFDFITRLRFTVKC